MKYLNLSFFITAILLILIVGFFPHWCILLFVALILLFVALYTQVYQIIKIRKQATIKAYYKENSFLHRYFGHFTLSKLIAIVVAFCGSVSLFFILMFPSGSDILILCLLVPISIYSYYLIRKLCIANLAIDFAPFLAKKYTAAFCALCACIASICLATQIPALELKTHYEALVQQSNITQMTCTFWKESFGFVLLKKAILDVLRSSIGDRYLTFALDLLYALGNFACFVSFSLLCLSGVKTSISPTESQEAKANTSDSHYSKIPILRIFTMPSFFGTLFFLIFLYIAFNISIHLQPLAKTTLKPHALISSQLVDKGAQYIEISVQGIHSFIDTKDLPALQTKIKNHLLDFQNELDNMSDESIDTYLAKKEMIIDAYSRWYFSIYGEYTRLFYNALGKGEEYAQEQFIFLLKTYTPYDLQEHLNGLYDTHLQDLKKKMQQTFELFSYQKTKEGAKITQNTNLDVFNQSLDLLSPRATDGISALLSISVGGVMILKASGKAIAKSGGKLLGKTALKKGTSTAVGAGGALLCGAFAPLCAIGFFVATDVVINSVDEALNEDTFKAKMREGFDLWEIQLKNSLKQYNAQLSSQILESIPLYESEHKE
ncbi:hypothetical protein [Helicobacter sp. MIT 05-5293]|uniref:hypothetical protein n=1 Tax=Helicobacter sp. MIT 05-5293 TaxID=1548149 RepID=UPI00051D7DFE|nr:hypothetical protein [Helicobacter sp. MIT 05-5293]